MAMHGWMQNGDHAAEEDYIVNFTAAKMQRNLRGDMHKWGEIYRNPGSSQLNRQAGEMIYTTVMNLEGVNQFILNKFCTIRNLQHFSNSYSAADAPTAFLEACKQYTRDVAFHGVHIGGAGVIAGYVLSKYGFLVKLPEPFVCPGKGHETLGQLLQQFADHEDMNAVHEHEVLGPWLAYCVLRAVYDAAWDASEDVLETAAGPEDSSAAAAAGPEEAAP